MLVGDRITVIHILVPGEKRLASASPLVIKVKECEVQAVDANRQRYMTDYRPKGKWHPTEYIGKLNSQGSAELEIAIRSGEDVNAHIEIAKITLRTIISEQLTATAARLATLQRAYSEFDDLLIVER